MPLKPNNPSNRKKTISQPKKEPIRKMNKKNLIRNIIIEVYESGEKDEHGDVVHKSMFGEFYITESEYNDVKKPKNAFIENYRLKNLSMFYYAESLDSYGRDIEPNEFCEMSRLRKNSLQSILADVRGLPIDDEQGNPIYY